MPAVAAATGRGPRPSAAPRRLLLLAAVAAATGASGGDPAPVPATAAAAARPPHKGAFLGAAGRVRASQEAASRAAAAAEAERASSRGAASSGRTAAVPGWGGPVWGGRSFEDSVANINPWSKVQRVPVVADLDPVAPLDRLDKGSNAATDYLDAAPLAPDRLSGEFTPSAPDSLKNDWVAPGSFPRTFAADAAAKAGGSDEAETPMAERNMVAAADKLRPPYAWRSSGNYPLVAPADRIINARGKAAAWFDGKSDYDPWPVASTERLERRFTKYMAQVHDRELHRQSEIRLDRAFKSADRDDDGEVSREEYEAELSGVQNKTEKEAEELWAHLHSGKLAGMDKAGFARLFRSGFDLGSIPRDDISSTLPMLGGPQRGFWGSGAACPQGGYVVGARLKVMAPAAAGADDTGLNAVGLRCSTGQEVSTIEGPDGTWTAWAECPAGQRVYSVRAKINAYQPGQDNTAIESLELGCRMPDLSTMGKLRFGGGNAVAAVGAGVFAKGGSTAGGGWSHEERCAASSAVCGAQAHVVRDQGKKDDMGVVSLRVYCCYAPVDCTTACGDEKGGPGSVGCQVCRQAAGYGKASPVR